MSKEKNILVSGANGTTGRIIIDLLKKSETYNPIAMVRNQDQKDHFEKQNVATIVADLEENLSHVMKNINKVIFAAGSKGKNIIGVDQEGAKRLIDAAKEAGIEKFVMLSSIGADDPSKSDVLVDYLFAKQNADEYLIASGLDYTIVRPGTLTDTEGTGKIELKEKLDSPGSITRTDVAQTLVQALEDDLKKNQVFEIIAGEVLIAKALQS
jgi:uncharacterized protein YbjT (DUF2867 family)